jgi:hypothetical protein
VIINSKWWEDHENVATMVVFQCGRVLSVLPDFGETAEAAAGIRLLAAAVEQPWEHREIFVAALLADPEVVVCRCGECQGKEWSVGDKLHAHFVELLDRGRSLNFAEPQDEEEAG